MCSGRWMKFGSISLMTQPSNLLSWWCLNGTLGISPAVRTVTGSDAASS